MKKRFKKELIMSKIKTQFFRTLLNVGFVIMFMLMVILMLKIIVILLDIVQYYS